MGVARPSAVAVAIDDKRRKKMRRKEKRIAMRAADGREERDDKIIACAFLSTVAVVAADNMAAAHSSVGRRRVQTHANEHTRGPVCARLWKCVCVSDGAASVSERGDE